MKRLLLGALVVAACTPGGETAMPDANGEGVGFDDMRFSPALGVIVPGARTGHIDLIDPETLAVRAVGSFSASPNYTGGHDVGVTTADDTGRWLVAQDRDTQTLYVVDPASGAFVAEAPLAHPSDYVRWVAGANEVWVTNTDAGSIEVFALAAPGPTLTKLTEIAVPGGPESLVIDPPHGRAYTNAFGTGTFAIDIASHAVAATWANTCDTSSGIALDPALGLLFSQCTEGKIVAIRTDTGAVTGSAWPSDHVDVITYSPSLRHLYLPSGIDSHVAIVGVSSSGELATLGSVGGALLGFCATTDDHGRIFLCDPRHGGVFERDDPFDAITE
jgi:DNA-binding beta-propeller fold protein YncE